jgi:cytidine deaminase
MIKINEKDKELLETAAKAKEHAYVFGGFRVGAVALGEDDKIYEGCNVESSISGLGTCAERCAIDHAVLHGNRKIKGIAVVIDADSCMEPRPCGACLQYISDFAQSSNVKVVMAKAKDGKLLSRTVDVKTVGELLPFPFRK